MTSSYFILFSAGLCTTTGQAWSLVKGGATSSKRNCRFCFCFTEEFGCTDWGCVYPRREEEAAKHLVAYWINPVENEAGMKGARDMAEVSTSMVSKFVNEWVSKAVIQLAATRHKPHAHTSLYTVHDAKWNVGA
jgi:hypothetical protein